MKNVLTKREVVRNALEIVICMLMAWTLIFCVDFGDGLVITALEMLFAGAWAVAGVLGIKKFVCAK